MQNINIKQTITEGYKSSAECITETCIVVERLVAITPKIVSNHSKKVNAEMDAIFAELGL